VRTREQPGVVSETFGVQVLGVLVVVLLASLLGSCGNAEPTPVPLPPLAGRLIFKVDNTYDDRDHRFFQALPQTGEQAAQEFTGGLPDLPVTADPFQCLDQARGAFCTVSPVGPFTLAAAGGKWRLTDWSNDSMGFLVDRDSGVELDPSGTDCKAVWRPDGDKVAVVATEGVYVADTTVEAQRVLERPREYYAEEGSATLGIPSQYVMYGASSCPTWVTPNDLLVSYYKGPFPESAKLPKPIVGQGIAIHGSPNTTSLLHLTSAGVEVRDLAGLWQVEVIDPQGRFAVVNLLASEGALQAGYYLVDSAMLAAGQAQEYVPLVGCSRVSQCPLFSFSPSGRRVAFSMERGEDAHTIEIWDADLGVLKSISVQPKLVPREIFWSPHSDALAVSYSSPPDVYIFVLEGEHLAHLEVTFLKQEGLFFELAGWVEP